RHHRGVHRAEERANARADPFDFRAEDDPIRLEIAAERFPEPQVLRRIGNVHPTSRVSTVNLRSPARTRADWYLTRHDNDRVLLQVRSKVPESLFERPEDRRVVLADRGIE